MLINRHIGVVIMPDRGAGAEQVGDANSYDEIDRIWSGDLEFHRSVGFAVVSCSDVWAEQFEGSCAESCLASTPCGAFSSPVSPFREFSDASMPTFPQVYFFLNYKACAWDCFTRVPVRSFFSVCPANNSARCLTPRPP